MTPAPSTACAHCDAELAQRAVTLVLDTGAKHAFCSDRCEHKWLVAQYVRQHRFLNRIYVSTHGKAAAIAKTALHTNEAP